ncbi:MAG: hypothetical protein ACOYOV_16855 [Bacteroidales bacterium]
MSTSFYIYPAISPIICLKMLVFSFIYTITANAQIVEKPIQLNEKNVEEKIENIAENTDAELDYTELVETMNYFKENPININNSNADELKKLLLINDIQINNLLNYIANTGELVSVYELQFINGFSSTLIFRILPYIVVEKADRKLNLNLKDVLKYGRHRIISRYQITPEEQTAYTEISDSLLALNPNQRYLGNAAKIFCRYAFNYRDVIKFGITADKDPGEEFFKGSQKNGFDFYSAYLGIKNIGIIKSLVIGDFQAQFGQGLCLWTGLSMGKSSNAIDVKKYAQGIKPYASANESGFMRGIGTTIAIKNFEISLFYSSKKTDANIGGLDSLTQENLYITSLQETGYHRTPAELADKNSLKETMFGSNITYKNMNFKIGATAYRTIFNPELKKEVALYNQFEFQGNENTNYGLHYNYLAFPFNFFGEFAASQNGGLACMSGLQASLDPRFSFSMIYRNYQKEYQNLKSIAFGENSGNANETGIFMGVELGLTPKFTVSAYTDLFSFPWLKYRTDAPSYGNEYFIKLNFEPSRKLEMYVQYRIKEKPINTASALIIKYLDLTKKQNLRFNISYMASENISLKNRIEFTHYQIGKDYIHNGFLIYQDISYQLMKFPIRFSARYALFDTDTYEERLYAFETDVLYAYSIPAYYYKGSRFYWMLKYDVNKNVDLWLRYAVSYYSGKRTIGSGLDEIQGSSKSDIKVQLMIHF